MRCSPKLCQRALEFYGIKAYRCGSADKPFISDNRLTKIASDHIVRFPRTRSVGVDFDLQSGMTDLEGLLQLTRQLQKEIVAGVAPGHDQMACHRPLGRADGPDVKIMDLRDTGSGEQKLPDGVKFDLAGAAQKSTGPFEQIPEAIVRDCLNCGVYQSSLTNAQRAHLDIVDSAKLYASVLNLKIRSRSAGDEAVCFRSQNQVFCRGD